MTIQYDVFNGDADGICALHQLRMAYPVPNTVKITGVKRDIRLLSKINNVEHCEIAVFDISMDSNKTDLDTLLQNKNKIFYIDHHFSGKIPENALLTTVIDPSPEVCTSLLVNTHLAGIFPKWAICGAFGDNLHEQANTIAASIDLDQQEIIKLKEIGELLNYNGYGSTVEDLHFTPEELYEAVSVFTDPTDFFDSEILQTLRQGYESDMTLALKQSPLSHEDKNRVYQLPDEPWARRISGVFANLKAREQQESAHALLTKNSDQTWRISVRAPLNDKKNADILCKQFPTGGGRAAAAGINNLPDNLLQEFLQSFQNTYP